jgi:hypothetical protein
MPQPYKPLMPGDWPALENIIQELYRILDVDTTLSTFLTSSISGTANQITVTDDGDGTVTLSLPQDIHTGASPTFAGLEVTSAGPAIVLVNGLDASPTAIFQFEKNSVLKWDIGTTVVGDDSFYIRETGSTTRLGIAPTTGVLTHTGDGVKTGGYLDVPEIAAPATPATNDLRLYTEAIQGFSFFKYLDDTGMKRQLLRDSMILVYNDSGSTIAAARIVYASGSSSNVPTIALAKADALATMPAIGVTIESIANGAFGRVMQVGLLEDVNTAALAEGDVLYVSAATAGVPTTTLPVTPNLIQEIGTVLVSNASTGAIQIVARSVRGDEYGTIQNDFYIGDGTAGSKTLYFNSATNGSIIWDETQFDLTASPLLTTGSITAGNAVLNGTIAIGLDMSSGTFATAIQKWPAGTISTTGTTIFQPAADSTTAYQWLDADGGTPILSIDTTNEIVDIDGTLDVSGTTNLDVTDIDAQVDISLSDSPTTAGMTVEHTQTAATAGAVAGLAFSQITTHSSGTIAQPIGAFGGAKLNSSSAVTTAYGVLGDTTVQGANTPAVLIAVGVSGSVTMAGGAGTYVAGLWGTAPTVGAGSIFTSMSVYGAGPSGATNNYAGLFEGDVLIASDKQLIMEGSVDAKGDTYFVYDSAGATLDCFVNATEVWNASTTTSTVPVASHLGGAATYLLSQADGDTYWVGTGAGLVYGHMYVDGDQSIIVALTANTPAEVKDDGTTSLDDGWLAGELNEMTFPTGGTEHYITVTIAGKYEVTWDMSFSIASPGATIQMHGGIAIDGTAVRTSGEAHRTIANNTDTGNMGATTIIDCPNGNEELSLWLENTTNNADATVDHGNLRVVLIGGT